MGRHLEILLNSLFAGSCWAFAAMGMLEASLVMNEQADLTVDLSEQQARRIIVPHILRLVTLHTAPHDLWCLKRHVERSPGKHFLAAMRY